MTKINWKNGLTGNWTNAGDWDSGTVPGTSDDAVIGSGEVDITTTVAVRSITLGTASDFATLDIESPGHTTTVSGDFIIQNEGFFSIDEGSGGGSALSVGGTLTNTGDVDIGLSDNTVATTVTVHALSNSGQIDIAGGTAQSTLNVTTGAVPTALNAGAYNLTGDALLEFASGGITSIGTDAFVSLDGAQARIAIAGSLATNSAFANLASNAGFLLLDDGATLPAIGVNFTNSGTFKLDGGLTISDSKNFTNSGELDLNDEDSTTAADTLAIAGALNNTGVITLGPGFFGESDSTTVATITAKTFSNTGKLFLHGAESATTGQATLNATSQAAPATLASEFDLEGNALLEFASGQITAIGDGGQLTLVGTHARVADASNTATNSALALTENDGELDLADGVSLAIAGSAFTNTGTLNLDVFFGDGGAGFSVASGTLHNSGSIEIGEDSFDGEAASSTLTTKFLDNTGFIDLEGAVPGSGVIETLNVTSGAAPSSLVSGVALTLSGAALLEFASGGITGIDDGARLEIDGTSAFVADAGHTTSNSALTALASNAGELTLRDGATLGNGAVQFTNSGDFDLEFQVAYSTTHTFTNNGRIFIDQGFSGGSTFSVAAALVNNGSIEAGGEDNSLNTTLSAQSLTNTGSIELDDSEGGAGTAALTVSGAATNSGTVTVEETASLALTTAGTAYTQSAGVTEIDGTLTAPTITLTGGILDGDGMIIGNVTNAGTAGGGTLDVDFPSAETLTIKGNYTQTAAGTLETTDYADGSGTGMLAIVNGNVALAGTLLVDVPDPEDLTVGETFTVLTFAPGHLTGSFSAIDYGSFTGNGSSVNIGGGLSLAATYDNADGKVFLTVASTSNAPPVLSEPGSETVLAGATTAIAGVSVSDPDAVSANETLTVQLSDLHGALSASTSATGGGGTISGSGTGHLTISGTLAQVNADLSTLAYTAGAVGSDDIALSVNDGRGGTGSGDIGVSITSPLSISAPDSAVTPLALGTSLGNIFVTDAANPSADITVSLSDTIGLFSIGSAGSATITGNGTTALSLSGSVTDVNAALQSLLTQQGVGDTVSLSAHDGLGGTAGGQITVTDQLIDQFNSTGTDIHNNSSAIQIANDYEDMFNTATVDMLGTISGSTDTIATGNAILMASASLGSGAGSINVSNVTSLLGSIAESQFSFAFSALTSAGSAEVRAGQASGSGAQTNFGALENDFTAFNQAVNNGNNAAIAQSATNLMNQAFQVGGLSDNQITQQTQDTVSQAVAALQADSGNTFATFADYTRLTSGVIAGMLDVGIGDEAGNAFLGTISDTEALGNDIANGASFAQFANDGLHWVADAGTLVVGVATGDASLVPDLAQVFEDADTFGSDLQHFYTDVEDNNADQDQAGQDLDKVGDDLLKAADDMGTLTFNLVPDKDKDPEKEFVKENGKALFDHILDLLKQLPDPDHPNPGQAFGDVHLTTYDGLLYNFQAEGEFVLSRSTVAGNPFAIQVRLEPWFAGASVSVITQLGAQVGSDRVTIDLTRADPVWVNGHAASFDSSGALALNGGEIVETAPGQYTITWNTGESATVINDGSFLSVSSALGPNDGPGSVQGLLGSDSGQASDFQLADGTVLGAQLSDADLYGEFANAWRVTQATSLLDYQTGQTTDTFTDLNFPGDVLSLSSLPADVVARAAALVAAAGITDPGLATAAELDYLATGNLDFITAAQVLNQEGVTTTPIAPTNGNAVTLVGVAVTADHFVAATSGATAVTFEIYRTGSTSGAMNVSYAVVAAGAGYATASSFGGTLPSGQATIANGQQSVQVTINLPGGLGALPDELLRLQIAGQNGTPIFAPTADAHIINNHAVGGTAPSILFQELQGLGALTHSGNAWTLALGDITKGSDATTLKLAIANAASHPADSLSGTFTTAGDGNFNIEAADAFSNVVPGSLASALEIAVETALAGTHSETITLTPVDVNDTGFSAAMPNITLTVTDRVTNAAQAVFEQVSGAGQLATGANGHGYTLDLGTLAQGASLASLVFDVRNAATGPADGLAGDFTVAGGSQFTNTGLSDLAGIAGGAASQQLSVAIDTSVAGSFTETITLHPEGVNSNGTSGGLAPVTLTISGIIAAPVGTTFTLTTGTDTIAGGPNNNTIDATAAALGAHDSIDGGAGTNTLVLQGAGTFDLRSPTKLVDIAVVDAQEGQAAFTSGGTTIASTRQTVFLRDGLNVTVNVASDTAVNAQNPNLAGITIVGGNDHDTINLGSGNDTVTLGSAAETVNGGGGGNRFIVNAATIGATIHGGSGVNTLEIAGGGAVALGGNITGIAGVVLDDPASGHSQPNYAFTTGYTSALSIRGSSGADTITSGAGADTISTGTGNDTVDGGAGNDTIVTGAGIDAVFGNTGDDTLNLTNTLTAADRIDGGAGNDLVELSGDYSAGVTFNATTLLNVETLKLAAGSNYAFVTSDATVAAGQTLTVNALALAATNTLVFNGGKETDGNFTVAGGAGNDTIVTGAGNDNINGGAGDDKLLAGSGNDTIAGGTGDDLVNLGAAFTAADKIDGGAGNDTLQLAGDYSAGVRLGAATMVHVETLKLGAGFNYGFTTNDANVTAGQTLTVNALALGAANTLNFNGNAETDGNFSIGGGAGDDTVVTGAGNDTVNGGDGDDIIRPGFGNDTVNGNGGNDVFNFGVALTAADSVNGGAGSDKLEITGDYSAGLTFAAATMTSVEDLVLGAGFNYALTTNNSNVAAGQGLSVNATGLGAANTLNFNGGAETDGKFFVRGGSGNDTIVTGAGNDTLDGGAGNDVLRAGSGNDIVRGGDGDDTINFGAALTVADRIDGGAGNDIVQLTGNYSAGVSFAAPTMVNVETLVLGAGFNYAFVTNNNTVAAGQTLTVNASALGAANTLVFNGARETDGSFVVNAGAGNDTIYTGAGGDTINGGAGNDILTPGSGNDIVNGGDGDDVFNFGAALTAADRIDGGNGTDTVALSGNYAAGLTLAAATMVHVEALKFGAGFNYALTTNNANVAAGQSLLVNAHALGAANTLNFNGAAETDGSFVVSAGAGNDTIATGAGSDTITGGDGNDTIRPGAGNDIVSGGAGNDIIAFGANLTAADKIDGGTGNDTVQLAGDYSAGVAFAASTMAHIGTITLGAGFDYFLSTADGNVAAGQVMTIDARALGPSDFLQFNGDQETDGSFILLGGAGDDSIEGSVGNDTFNGGLGADSFAGLSGNNVFVYAGAADSTGAGHDTIINANFAHDKFDLPGSVAAINTAIASGALSTASFDGDLTTALSGHLGAHDAILFTPDSGSLSGRTFLIVDMNGTAGYQAEQDLVIQLNNAQGTLALGNFI